ncbi:SRPBCC family protein [Streptomyces sp. FXJ1.4098]|nr:SRPBCC family protein [Streptomyces sp. FXJ1.4098]
MAERADGQRHLGALSTLTEELPTERLMKETQNLLTALGERALSTVTHLGEGGGVGLKSPVKPLLKMGAQQVLEKAEDKVKDAVPLLGGGGDGGKGKKLKVTNIVEQIDVGVPVSVAYDQWTRFEDFPGFMKKVEDVEQTSDEEVDWKAQIFLSHREWHAEIIDQVPDQHIVWRSRGQKGHVDGAVTFHEVAPPSPGSCWSSSTTRRASSSTPATSGGPRAAARGWSSSTTAAMSCPRFSSTPTRSRAGAVRSTTARSSPRRTRSARKRSPGTSTRKRTSTTKATSTTRNAAPAAARTSTSKRRTRKASTGRRMRTRSPSGARAADEPLPRNG